MRLLFTILFKRITQLHLVSVNMLFLN